MARGRLGAKLGHRVYGRVRLPADLVLSRAERESNLGKTRLAHDQDIHVTAHPLFVAGHRAIDEGKPNAARKRRQGGAQQVAHTGGLRYNALQFGENRTFRIGLVEHLVPAHCAPEDASFEELLQFSLYSADTASHPANYLA